MFPSATSPGNPLLTSVSGETAHMGKRRRSAPARPRKLFPFPSRAAYREERERSSRPRKCRRCSPRRSSARFRPQPPDAPSAAHSRKRGAAAWHSGRRGSARPGPGWPPSCVPCPFLGPSGAGLSWRLPAWPAARDALARPGALSRLCPRVTAAGEEGGSRWAGPRARAAASCILASVPRAARSRARSQAPVTGWGREARHAGLACSLASCCRGPGLRCH